MSLGGGLKMKNMYRQALLAGLACLAVSPGVAQAATNGSLGSTSTGTVSISATVPNNVQISKLTDITIAPTDLTAAVTSAQNVCVWSNTSTKGYTIKASGSGGSSAFTLANSALTVPYSVEWSATSGQTSGTSLTAATASSTLVSTATNPTCSAGAATTASLIVKMTASDLQTMVGSASYTGTLTLLVSPI